VTTSRADRRLFFKESRINNAGQKRARDGSDPEKPQLFNCATADEYRRTRAARGVDGEVGYGNPNQVDEREAKSNRDGRKARAARRSVEPRMIMRNMKVKTISATSAAAML
jgi:hypothetical protein